MTYDADRYHEIENLVTEAFDEISNHIENVNRLQDIYETSNKIDPNAINYQIGSLISEALVSGLSVDKQTFNFHGMSLEAIQSRKDGAFKNAWDQIKQVYQKNLDSLHYTVTLFNTQQSRLRSLRRRLESIKGNPTADIEVPITKYVMTGSNYHLVRDAKEYIKEFGELVEVMKPFSNAAKNFADDDIFVSFKMLNMFIKGQSELFVIDRFKAIKRTIDNAKKSNKLKLEEKGPHYSIYASDVLLGCGQITVHDADENTYSFDNEISMIDALRHFYMYLYRQDKIRFSDIVDGNVSMLLSKDEVLKLTDDAESLLNITNEMLDLTTRVSNKLAAFNSIEKTWLSVRSKGDDYVPKSFLRSMRFIQRSSAIIFDSVSSTYNFNMGNIKKCLSICEKATSEF